MAASHLCLDSKSQKTRLFPSPCLTEAGLDTEQNQMPAVW
jgi:hypothetical protein